MEEKGSDLFQRVIRVLASRGNNTMKTFVTLNNWPLVTEDVHCAHWLKQCIKSHAVL